MLVTWYNKFLLRLVNIDRYRYKFARFQNAVFQALHVSNGAVVDYVELQVGVVGDVDEQAALDEWTTDLKLRFRSLWQNHVGPDVNFPGMKTNMEA